MSSYAEGQVHQLANSLEGAGFTPAHITALGQNSNGVLNQLMLILTGVAKVVTDLVFRLVSKIDRNMDGWKCVEPVEAEDEFEPFLNEFLKQGEGYIGGEEMIKRSKEKGISSGLRHLEAMLRNQEKIPVEWRKYVLVSTEIWQTPDGDRNVWYLYWDGKRWYLSYDWLSHNFNSDYRLVGSRKCQKSLDS